MFGIDFDDESMVQCEPVGEAIITKIKPKKRKVKTSGPKKFVNLSNYCAFIEGLDVSKTNKHVQKVASEFGATRSKVVYRNIKGKFTSLGKCAVEFSNEEDLNHFIQEMDDKPCPELTNDENARLTVRVATERDREWFVKSKNKTVTKKKKKETKIEPVVSQEFIAKIHEEYKREQIKKEADLKRKQEKENEEFLSLDLNAYPEDSDDDDEEESPQKKQKLE